ncbi:neprilysin-like [Discoglossus pictus]
MDNWDAVYGANWTAEKALINLNVKFMSQSLINVQVSKDMKNSSSLILYIDQPELGLSPTDYYSCSEPYDKVCLAYLDYMVSLATLIRQERNLTVDTAKIKAEMDRVFELEKAIAGATVSQLIRQDANNVYIRMTVAEVEKDYEVVINGTKINWLSYINALIAPGGVSITADDYVVMYSSEYIQNITSFIATFSGRDIQNYLAWHYVRKVVDGLSKEYTDPGKIYSQVFEGAVGNKPLWKDCVSFMAVEFDDVIGRLYVEKAFLGDNKATVKTMIAEIRKMFLEILEEQKWMDEQTKQKAALKALKIREQVGFPDDLFNDTKMTETYDKLEFKTDDFFDNKRKFYEYVQIVRASRLKKPADPNEWKNGASEINAEYSTIDNTIEFPAGILQTPFFNVLEPRSLNYGGIGTVIGHEITHGFDGSGKDFDENGNLFNWWSEESLKKFNDLTQCFVDQYENFSWAQAGGKKLSGASTLEENIADNGGVRQAYRAYKDYLRNNGREKNLPGLDLTNEQLFFIGFGQIWCSTYTQQYAVTSITDDEHSPGEFRVIGTLQNFPEFSEVFSCKSDDYMNPKKKCHLW